MKKFLMAGGFFAAFLASSSFAQGFFAGVDGSVLFGRQKDKISISSSLGTPPIYQTIENQSLTFNPALNFGYIFSPNHRVYVSYSYLDLSSTNKFLLGYDFTPQIDGSLRGDLGIYGGFAKASKFSGGAYGLKLGALYELNEYNEINFGVKFEQIPFNEYKTTGNANAIDYSSSNERTITNYGLYVGYVYKF